MIRPWRAGIAGGPYAGGVNPRLALAVSAGKLAGVAARRAGRGGGTALPGLVAERLDPGLVGHLASQLQRGRVTVSGTNGKTTTSRVIASIFEAAGMPYVHNREGSNLMRGLASTLLGAAGPTGAIPRAAHSFGLFEVDEATLPLAVPELRPTVLAFTNLFRDQLDRYGEVDTVFALWSEALAKAPRDATLVLNADDPSVAELASGWAGPVHWYGLEDPSFSTAAAGAADARWCRSCGGSYAYGRRYFAHVGLWRCRGCERRRPEPHTAARDVTLALGDAAFAVEDAGSLKMRLTGAYNVYNALAAVAVARVLGLPSSAIIAGVGAARPAFGRQEVVEVQGRRLHLLLCKNPAGANQVLLLLASVGGEGLKVATLLNDRFADGQDVSWTWDVDYEVLAGKVERCWAAGDRAEDMALRLTYAGWPRCDSVVHEPGALIEAILAGSEAGEDIFVIPTYTAMLDLRAELVRIGAAQPFFETE